MYEDDSKWYKGSLLDKRNEILKQILDFFTINITDPDKILELTSLWGGEDGDSFADVWDVFTDCPFVDESEFRTSLEELKQVIENTLLKEGFLDTSVDLLTPIVSTLNDVIKQFEDADEDREDRAVEVAIESLKRKRCEEDATHDQEPTGKRRR